MNQSDHSDFYHPPPSHESEVTLADIIRTVQDYIRHLFRKWYWILGAALIGGLMAFGYVRLQTISYLAEITFVANEDSQRGGNSILASTLASFGLSGGESGNEGGRYSKIIALSQSRKIQFAALLDSVELHGKKDLMINHFSEVYDLQNEWEVQEPVRFSNTVPDSMNLVHRQYLKRIYNLVVGGSSPIYTVAFDNTSQMIKMQAEAIDEDLSIVLIHAIYEKLSEFYILQSTAKGEEIVSTLTYRKDSLENVLQNQQARLAVATDRARGMTYRSQQTNRLDLDVEVSITRAMYMEIVRNLETARFSLENIRPVFSIIDYPLTPLNTNRQNQTRMMIIFGVVFAVLVTMFLILGKMYRDIMRPRS